MGKKAVYAASNERRTSERGDPLRSLSLWLEAARRMLAARAIAVGDSGGCLVTGAGAVRECEELAAWGTIHHKGLSASGPSIATVAVPGFAAFVTLSDATGVSDAALIELALGCHRILEQLPPRSST